jgi:hypothetical protein
LYKKQIYGALHEKIDRAVAVNAEKISKEKIRMSFRRKMSVGRPDECCKDPV